MHGADQGIRSSHGCTAAQIGTEGVQKVFQGINTSRPAHFKKLN